MARHNQPAVHILNQKKWPNSDSQAGRVPGRRLIPNHVQRGLRQCKYRYHPLTLQVSPRRVQRGSLLPLTGWERKRLTTPHHSQVAERAFAPTHRVGRNRLNSTLP